MPNFRHVSNTSDPCFAILIWWCGLPQIIGWECCVHYVLWDLVSICYAFWRSLCHHILLGCILNSVVWVFCLPYATFAYCLHSFLLGITSSYYYFLTGSGSGLNVFFRCVSHISQRRITSISDLYQLSHWQIITIIRR